MGVVIGALISVAIVVMLIIITIVLVILVAKKKHFNLQTNRAYTRLSAEAIYDEIGEPNYPEFNASSLNERLNNDVEDEGNRHHSYEDDDFMETDLGHSTLLVSDRDDEHSAAAETVAGPGDRSDSTDVQAVESDTDQTSAESRDHEDGILAKVKIFDISHSFRHASIDGMQTCKTSQHNKQVTNVNLNNGILSAPEASKYYERVPNVNLAEILSAYKAPQHYERVPNVNIAEILLTHDASQDCERAPNVNLSEVLSAHETSQHYERVPNVNLAEILLAHRASKGNKGVPNRTLAETQSL